MNDQSILTPEEAKEIIRKIPAQNWTTRGNGYHGPFDFEFHSIAISLYQNTGCYFVHGGVQREHHWQSSRLFHYEGEEFKEVYEEVRQKVIDTNEKDLSRTLDFLNQIGCSEGLVSKVKGAMG